MSSNTQKYTNHTKEEIREYLKVVKNNVNSGKFIVPQTRKRNENRNFIEKYRLDSNKQRKMINDINIEDFCYSVDNYNDPKERLYIFNKEYELDNWGIIENVDVYIKIVIKENKFIVVVSFHEPKKKINKLFL